MRNARTAQRPEDSEEEEDREASRAELELEESEYEEHKKLERVVTGTIGIDEETKEKIIDQFRSKLEAIYREGDRRRRARAITRMDAVIKEANRTEETEPAHELGDKQRKRRRARSEPKSASSSSHWPGKKGRHAKRKKDTR